MEMKLIDYQILCIYIIILGMQVLLIFRKQKI